MRGISVTVISDNPGGFDEYGDPIASTGDTRMVAGCFVAPDAAPESMERGREGEVVTAVLVAPPGAEILRQDRIVVPDTHPSAGIYEVVEPVREWVSKSGVNRGALVSLKKAAG